MTSKAQPKSCSTHKTTKQLKKEDISLINGAKEENEDSLNSIASKKKIERQNIYIMA
jgi:hypothetical protein